MPTDHDVSVATPDGVHLAGTLTVPDGPGPHGAALLLVGSGEVDRDSDHAKLELGVTRELAMALAEAGVASLRYDKRGVGSSGGTYLTTTFAQAREDAGTALRALRDRPEVDPARVVLVGHSEGAIHAAALAADDVELAGVALVSGQAATGEATMRWQGAAILPTLPRVVRGLLTLLRQTPSRAQDKLFARVRASDADVLRVQGRKLNAGWLRGFLDHDTGADLARIRVPVLALTGGADLQTDPDDVERVRRLVTDAPVTTQVVPEVNHILRRSTRGGSPTEYRKLLAAGTPIDPRVLDAITSWVVAHVAPPTTST